jgi:hypothetical protein
MPQFAPEAPLHRWQHVSGLPRVSFRRVEESEHRLRALLDAGIAVTSELSLDAVLQRLVETAAELTGARYAALGVIDRAGQGLERFMPRRKLRSATFRGVAASSVC